MSRLPTVAIIGRPNVGKSTLFNRLIGRRMAITHQKAHTTRDRLQAVAEWSGQHFWLLDTAGLTGADTELEASIQSQIEEAIGVADVLLVVVDGRNLPTKEDRQAARLALKSEKPVILAVNKLDEAKMSIKAEFHKLGIADMQAVSAIHRRGTGDLLDKICQKLPEVTAENSHQLTLSLLGRPNVGKSSMFNQILGREAAIIHDQPHTTRDVNQRQITIAGREVTLLDTAGVRRSGQVRAGLEKFSHLRTIQAIKRADVCLVVIDATEPATKLDQKVAGLAKEAGKGIVFAANKWDLLANDETSQKKLIGAVENKFQFVWWAPLVFTSATTNQNVDKLLEQALVVSENRSRQFEQNLLDEILKFAQNHHEPSARGQIQPKLSKITQSGTNPPTFTVWGKQASQIHWSYRRFLETTLRENLQLGGTPIWLDFEDE